MTEARALAVWAEPGAVELLDLLRTAYSVSLLTVLQEEFRRQSAEVAHAKLLLTAPGCPSEDPSAVAPLPYRP